MIIRPAVLSDVVAIAELWNGMIRDTLVTWTTVEKSMAAVEEMIDAATVLVAEADETFLGFGRAARFRPGPGYAHTYEHNIYVTEAARRSGAGRALLTALELRLRGQGVHVLVAGISSANPAAIEFHAAMGFRHAGIVSEAGRKWDQWLDLVLMQKRLDA